MHKHWVHLFITLLLLTAATGPSLAAESTSVTITGYILPSSKPNANFAANTTSGAAPLAVRFTDLSTGNPESWAWDFDNNSVTDSTERNPQYVYPAPGTYSVKLTATNMLGSDIKIKTGYITVTAQNPVYRIHALKTYVGGLSIPAWAKWLLTVPLTNAERSLERGNERAARSMMRTFIDHVRMLRWLGVLKGSQANYMIGEAQQIIDLIND